MLINLICFTDAGRSDTACTGIDLFCNYIIN